MNINAELKNQSWRRPNKINLILSIAATVCWLVTDAQAQTNTKLLAWGDQHFGKCTIPTGLSNVVAASAGGEISSVLQSDGTVLVWGYSLNGQTNVPTDLSGVMAIAAGGYHTLALKSNG